jgi:hypothetical protein
MKSGKPICRTNRGGSPGARSPIRGERRPVSKTPDAGATGWLLAGTGLTVAIALLRGLSGEVRALVLALRY